MVTCPEQDLWRTRSTTLLLRQEEHSPTGFVSLLHPDPCFTPDFPLARFLEALGVSLRHGGFPYSGCRDSPTDRRKQSLLLKENVQLGIQAVVP